MHPELEVQKQCYTLACKNYIDLLAQAKQQAVKTVISQGRLFNVLPFEGERYGERVQGKELTAPILSDECYIYYLDDQQRIVLSERISTALQKPAYFKLYYYQQGDIQQIYGDTLGPICTGVLRFEGGQADRSFYFSQQTLQWERYHYHGKRLIRLERYAQPHHGKTDSMDKLEYEYLYHQDGTLACIQLMQQDGTKQTIYTDQVIQDKPFGRQFLHHLRSLFS